MRFPAAWVFLGRHVLMGKRKQEEARPLQQGVQMAWAWGGLGRT